MDSVAQLNDFVEEFGGRVIGIDPGAGMMRISQQIIDAYGLRYELVEGSEFAMLAAVSDAIRAGEWIVFLAWRPHFMFAQHDLKMLKEEQGFWHRDHVVKVARRGFADDFPQAARLIANWEMSLDDIERMINDIEVHNRSPREVAERWVQQNRDAVRRWTMVD